MFQEYSYKLSKYKLDGKFYFQSTLKCSIENIKEKTSNEKMVGLSEKLGTKPLRLIIIGHNPSAHAWSTGHYYSHPSNRCYQLKIHPIQIQFKYELIKNVENIK